MMGSIVPSRSPTTMVLVNDHDYIILVENTGRTRVAQAAPNPYWFVRRLVSTVARSTTGQRNCDIKHIADVPPR